MKLLEMAAFKKQSWKQQNDLTNLCMLTLQIVILVGFSTFTYGAFTKGEWYKGCFRENLTQPELKFFPGDWEYINSSSVQDQLAKQCTSVCSGENMTCSPGTKCKYAALLNNGLCFCSISYSSLLEVTESNCIQVLCLLNDTSCCEGKVYARLFDLNQAIKGVNIITSSPMKAISAENVSVVLSSGSTTNLTFRIDFGDGIQTPRQPGAVRSHVYSAQGSYIITVTVENAYSIPVSVSKVVQVVSAPGYIHDNCPKAWEVGVEGTCLITISQGSEMTANIDATLLAESANIQLAVEDAVIIPVGCTPLQLMVAASTVTTPINGTYIMPLNGFGEKGSIVAFEFYASKAGILRFQVYRPDCTATPSTSYYCHPKRECTATASCPSCNLTCPGTDVYCGITYNFQSNPAPASYRMVSEIIFLVNSTGYKFLPVKTSKFEVEAGDVLGITLSSTGGDISHVTGAQEAEYYFESPTEVIPGSQFSAGSLNKKTIRHLIRAHLSLLSKLELQATYTVTAGVVRIFSKFSNAIGQRNATKNLPVEERIQGLNFVSPGMYTTKGYIRNNEMTMTASITKGSNVTFYWTVSCESKKNYTGNSTTKDWKFTPIELGICEVFLKAENLLGSENVTRLFGVHDKIDDLEVVNINDAKVNVLQKEMATLMAKVINGTNVTMKVDWKDGTPNTTFILDASGGYKHNFTHRYSTCGTYSAKIEAYSLVGNNMTVEVTVQVFCPIDGLEISTNPQKSESGIVFLSLRKDLEVTITITSGTSVIYTVDFGDNRKETVNRFHEIIKRTPVKMVHRYKNLTTFVLKVTVRNEMGFKVANCTIKVQNCPMPEVKFSAAGPNDKTPVYVKRGQTIHVNGEVERLDEKCENDLKDLQYGYWTLYQLDDSLNTYKPIGQKIKAKKDNLQYAIEKYKYDHGLYRLELTQTLQNEARQYTSYIRIIESPLVAIIDYGNERDVPSRKKIEGSNSTASYNFTVKALGSYDPDVTPSTNEGIEFTFSCRRVTPNVIARKALLASNKTESDLLCYSMTDNILKNTHFSTDRGSIQLNTSSLLSNVSYVFEVLIRKGSNRTGTANQTVNILPGDPPSIAFNCVANCKKKVNYQEKTIVRGSCDSCDPTRKVLYKWELLDENKVSVDPVNQNPSPSITSTGWRNKDLVILERVLKPDKKYKLRMEAKYEGGTSSTKLLQSIKTASKPSGGSCSTL